MFKKFGNPSVAIKLCRYQLIKLANVWHRHLTRHHHFKCEIPAKVFSAASVALPRSYCTTINLDDNDNDGLEDELLDEPAELFENGLLEMKDYLCGDLPNDDAILVKISNCSSEDVVSTLHIVESQRKLAS